MFDAIAERYDFVNRVLSMGIDVRWRKQLVRSMPADARRVLDVATGTGDVAIALASEFPELEVVGVDPSDGMLRVGQEKVKAQERITLEAGDAQALRFDDGSFDGATIAFGIRNVPDRDAGLREMTRVVRPGGHVSVLELSEPKAGLFSTLARLWIREAVPRIGALLSGKREYRYLQSSIAAFPPPSEFAAQMERAGLVDIEIRPLTFGVCCLYVGKVPS
jgi:demethylmenaquinone methyltransferase/2-methoxy-6-polyprenyl-1,4-benzoquinol methylase